MFEELNFLIREDTVRAIYQAKIEKTPEPTQQSRATAQNDPGQQSAAPRRPAPINPALNRNIMNAMNRPVATANPTGPQGPRRVSAAAKVGRNDPCPCGSGKKYKNCCGKNLNETNE